MSSRSSVNMLRTRRKDNNVKPNRREFRAGRLDRKSSRGMIYENEELRLRTININAEIERGQYDIKKLKKENELLKKEIWCLRDEYEKLDKLLKDKNIDFSSSSTTSDSDTCSSCPDESDDVENSQNLENDQKTNERTLSRTFAALSVVPEESTENSDRTSNAASPIADDPHHHLDDDDVIQADQSYPCYEQSATLRMPPKGFYAARKDLVAIPPGGLYGDDVHQVVQEAYGQYTSNKIVNTEATNFYQNIVLVPRPADLIESETLGKAGIDVLAKMDNRGFAAEPNGGGYAEQFADDFPRFYQNFGTNSRSTFSNGGNLEELLNDIESISQDILAISNVNNQSDHGSRRCKSDINPGEDKTILQVQSEKPFKSELNVTLMPQPMALIGLEKYREIQRSMNNTPSKSMENLSGHAFQDNQTTEKKDFNHFQQSSTDISDFTPIRPLTPNLTDYLSQKPTTNLPSYLANLKDNYVSGDYFARYNPENFPQSEKNKPIPKILVKQVSIDHPCSENEENNKIKQETRLKSETTEQKMEETPKKEEKQKMGLRKKVSIHFRGKKEKQKNTLELPTNTIKKHSPVRDKNEVNNENTKINHQKTSSKDSNKTTSDSDTKNNTESRKTVEKSDNDKKLRKSASASPDRKKKEDKKSKKHKKERMRLRRATVTSLESRDHRARSHSVNTDRSNTFGGSHFLYDDYMNSERDSMSSSETLKTRQMNFSSVPMAGKVPWCGCWGNGCI